MSWELIPTSGLDTASDRQRCEQTSYVTFLSRAIPLSGEVRTGTVGGLVEEGLRVSQDSGIGVRRLMQAPMVCPWR